MSPTKKVEAIVSEDILSLADQFRDLKAKKEELAALTKDNNQEISNTEEQLSSAMVMAEVSLFRRAGRTFYLNPQLFCSAKADQKENLHQWLKDHEAGDLVQETVHAGSLKSYVKELKDDDAMPEDLAEMLNIFEKIGIGMRSR